MVLVAIVVVVVTVKDVTRSGGESTGGDVGRNVGITSDVGVNSDDGGVDGNSKDGDDLGDDE